MSYTYYKLGTSPYDASVLEHIGDLKTLLVILIFSSSSSYTGCPHFASLVLPPSAVISYQNFSIRRLIFPGEELIVSENRLFKVVMIILDVRNFASEKLRFHAQREPRDFELFCRCARTGEIGSTKNCFLVNS